MSTRSNRDAGLLTTAVVAVTTLVAAGIGVVPDLGSWWSIGPVVGALIAAVLWLSVYIVRQARMVLAGQPGDASVVDYMQNRETGVLLKGSIENVALRVSTVHRIVDSLLQAVPEHMRREALYECGCDIGSNWAADFRRQLPALQIRDDDLPLQLLKWSEYDATAGMGRLSVAVDPLTGQGLVMLANSFLSRGPAFFPLNWWFAGYLAGTLGELLGRDVDVEVIEPKTAIAPATFFRVQAAA